MPWRYRIGLALLVCGIVLMVEAETCAKAITVWGFPW